MKKLSIGFRVIAVLLALIAAYLLINLFVVWREGHSDHVKDSDAIVVLGAAQYNGQPSKVFRARLDKAYKLYKDGRAPLIVVSGGKQSSDRVTEATAGANYLLAKGVKNADLLREVKATNTWQELEAISAIMKDRDLNSVILVSDGFHLARAKAIAEHFGLKASTAVAGESPIRGWPKYSREIKESLALSAARIVGYPRIYRVEHHLQQSTNP